MAKIKAVIFDMDGLMFDTERLSLDNWVKAGASFGYDIPSDLVMTTVGANKVSTKKTFVDRFGLTFPFDEINDLGMAYSHEDVVEKGVPVKEGLFDMIEFCKKSGLAIAVATSSDRMHASDLLRRSQVKGFFDDFVFGDEVPISKPAPDIFLMACDKLAVKPHECIVLEDSENGIKGASKAGMIPIHVPDLIMDTVAIRKHAKHRCKSLNEAVAIIEGYL